MTTATSTTDACTQLDGTLCTNRLVRRIRRNKQMQCPSFLFLPHELYSHSGSCFRIPPQMGLAITLTLRCRQPPRPPTRRLPPRRR